MSDLKVSAYRGKRNYHLGTVDYSKIVRDDASATPVRERAEKLARELHERLHRNRLGWTHMRITSVTPTTT